MGSPQDWNKAIIEEFRANGGKVGGMFEGRTLLLLHTSGAKSGQPHINPVAYVKDGDRFVIIASKGGAPTNPDWYYNLVANPWTLSSSLQTGMTTDTSRSPGTCASEGRVKITLRGRHRTVYGRLADTCPRLFFERKKRLRHLCLQTLQSRRVGQLDAAPPSRLFSDSPRCSPTGPVGQS